jgi:hypothetical protein
MNKLVGMFTGSGKPDEKISSMRVASLAVVFVVLAIYVAQNIISMVHNGGIVSLSWEMVSLLTAVLGVKAYQHRNELINGNGSGGDDDDDETTTAVRPEPTVPAAIVAPPGTPVAITPVPSNITSSGLSNVSKIAAEVENPKVLSAVEKVAEMVEKK